MIITTMSKLMKIILLSAYGIVLIRYLKNSVSPSKRDIVLVYLTSRQYENKSLSTLLKINKNNLTALKLDYKRPKRFHTDLKFILRYTKIFANSLTCLDSPGQETFIQNKCEYTNCFITNNKEKLFDIRNFDAILFDVENTWDGGLLLREPYQKFVFLSSDSSANYPLCDQFYNNYYNWTMTYKLNSDVLWTYFKITDKKGKVIGPRVNMTWIDPMKPTPVQVKEKLVGKKKAAAWFVSNCNTKSNRGDITEAIQTALQKYGHIIDIFGWCGRLTCPRDRLEDCLSLLESEYYFYLSFENSFSEDYVTEKALYPLQHYSVPIVYGGADYSRFLPPNSYIDARKLNATQVADEMVKAIANSTIYENYFKWHNYYEYIDTSKNPDVCKLCQILNEESHRHFAYEDFLHWWNPDYLRTCSEGEGRVLVKDSNSPLLLQPIEIKHLE